MRTLKSTGPGGLQGGQEASFGHVALSGCKGRGEGCPEDPTASRMAPAHPHTVCRLQEHLPEDSQLSGGPGYLPSVTALGCAPWEALTERGELPGPPPSGCSGQPGAHGFKGSRRCELRPLGATALRGPLHAAERVSRAPGTRQPRAARQPTEHPARRPRPQRTPPTPAGLARSRGEGGSHS